MHHNTSLMRNQFSVGNIGFLSSLHVAWDMLVCGEHFTWIISLDDSKHFLFQIGLFQTTKNETYGTHYKQFFSRFQNNFSLLQLLMVLVCQSCHSSYQRLGGASKTEIDFLPVMEAGSQRPRYQEVWFLLRFLSLAYRWALSPWVLTWPSLFLCLGPDLFL